MNMPAVSVIVPNYNHAPYLKQRIESILQQTFRDFELILLDDCSTDDSRLILKSYQDNPLVSSIEFNQQNGGDAFLQWQKGIEKAKGQWIWIAESDDWAEPVFLEVMLNEAKMYPDCGLLISPPCYIYPSGGKWHELTDGGKAVFEGRDFILNKMLIDNPIHNVSSILIRRDCLCHVDWEPVTSLKLCGDWLLYCQLCKMTNVLEIHQSLSNYRIHTTNTSTYAEKRGLPLTEGVAVLRYLVENFEVKNNNYAKGWGKKWAKLELVYKYDKQLRSTINKEMRPFPLIRFWHNLYKMHLWLK